MFEPKSLAAPAMLLALWLLETWLPFFRQFGSLRQRLGHDGKNLLWGAVSSGLGLAAVVWALGAVDAWASAREFGLVRQLPGPPAARLSAAVLLLDLWTYWWHRANHELRWLWRFHRMHHSDPQMDATTGVRFHAGEIALSWLARLAVVPALGVSLPQLVVYEGLLLPVVLLHHANLRLPRWLEVPLAAVIVTPDMHRVHHSQVRAETNSNYGSLTPWWDRLFASWRRRPDQEAIVFGLPEFAAPRWQRLEGMLLTPLAAAEGAERPAPEAEKGRGLDQPG
jgi:sterol desaturase/sphingolipid hydroxylase (fatty acid hydroxylase superfamily)